MRTHLFKGIDVMSLNKWIEGNLRVRTNCVDPSCNRYLIETYVHNPDPYGYGGKWMSLEVFPETVCEFTGLLDIDGRKIWEYDIVYFNRLGATLKGKVKWRKGKYIVSFTNERGESESTDLVNVLDSITRESTSIIR